MAIVCTKFFSNCLRRTVPFMAILPNDGGFDKFGNPEFETGKMRCLYLLHGYTGDETDYLANTPIRELSRKYKIAVIMSDGDNSFYVDNVAEKRFFGEYVGEELIQYTRRLFHLSEKREDTFIGGLSMGGYGAMRNGLKYAHNFSRIFALSGAYVPVRIAENGGIPENDGVSDEEFQCRVFGDPQKIEGSDLDPRYIYGQLKKKGEKIPQIYMAEGSEDMLLKENHMMRDFFESENADFIYEEDSGVHDWDFWNKHLEDAFKFITGIKQGK